MKKFGLLVLSIVVLSACSQDQGNIESTSESTAEATVQSSSQKSDSKDVGNGLLEEVGQYSTKNGATTTLLSIAKTEESNEIAEGVIVENVTAKVMSVDEIDEDYSDRYSYMDIYNGDYMLQITFDMKNDTTNTLQNINSPTVITSNGEQIMFDNLLGDYELLSGGTTYQSGASSKINDHEINGLTINWDIFQEDENYSEIETQPLDIKF